MESVSLFVVVLVAEHAAKHRGLDKKDECELRFTQLVTFTWSSLLSFHYAIGYKLRNDTG